MHFFNSHSIAEGKLEGVEEKDEYVCSYWISLRKTDNTELERGNDRTLWRTHTGRGYGPLARQTIYRMNREINPTKVNMVKQKCLN